MAASNKTVESDASVAAFLAQVEPPERAEDARALTEILRELTGLEPAMWGSAIIGFGSVHYRYDSGREGDMAAISFSPRKAELALYVGASNANVAALLPALGKHRTGKGCVYVKRLADVDAGVLREVLQTAWANRLANAA